MRCGRKTGLVGLSDKRSKTIWRSGGLRARPPFARRRITFDEVRTNVYKLYRAHRRRVSGEGFEPLQCETKSVGHRRKIYQRHGIFRRNFRESCNNARKCFRSSIASFVKNPCLSSFLFSLGAPDPGAPPCIRQRFLPCTAGDLQEPPFRVLAPQR